MPRSGEENTYCLVHTGKNAQMWNTVFHEHQFKHPQCNGFLSWDLSHEEKRGVVWRERALCSTCIYASKMFNLYDEVQKTKKKGRKAACVNSSIQIGLSQSTYIQVEDTTPEKKVINIITKNKLCTFGKTHTLDDDANLRHCSANISLQRNIGDENSWCKEGFMYLKKSENLEVHNITTDPDTASFRASLDLRKEGVTKTVPENHIDTRHLGQNHTKFIKKQSKLIDFIPGRTYKRRENMRNNFADDLSKRCQAEFGKSFQKCGKCTPKLISNLSYATDAIVKCYQGDQSLCYKQSNGCLVDGCNWVSRSTFLPRYFKLKISSESEESTLRMCIEFRLGKSTVLKTKLNKNTQKVKSVNRRIKHSLPKNITFKRNFHSRTHSAVHNCNHGPGESLVKLCKFIRYPVVILWHNI